MRILVTGASGLLGEKVAKLALERGHDVFSVYKEHPVTIGTAIKLDITNKREITDLIYSLRPDTIVHTAAYTNVDACEVNKELACHVNAEATKNIAIASADVKAHLIYVSTDYVFDGEKGYYEEGDTPSPINYYGYMKLKGEEFVKNNAKDWCIARTSAIYGWGGSKLNFATWLVENLRKGREVKVLVDQYVSPTLNTNLAQMLLEMAEKRLLGTFHTAGANRINRYEFALKLAKVFKLDERTLSSHQAWMK